MKSIKRTLYSLAIILILTLCVFSGNEASAASTTILKVGSGGEQVADLQKDLKVLGYFDYSSITGYYGSITRYSVMKFQGANNLYVDGIAGPVTLSKIESLLGSRSVYIYTVKAGDTLWTIALKYGTTTDRLKVLNNLTSDTIFTGQVLRVSAQGYSPTVPPVTENQNPDLYWLSRIIHAEAEAEPYLGKVAVGNVVLNRKASSSFPGTVKGVIFEYYKGIPQFSPVADGTIYNNPSGDSIRAAQEALNGARPVGSATYFFNPDKSAAPWIVSNKIYVTRIGDHVFYR